MSWRPLLQRLAHSRESTIAVALIGLSLALQALTDGRFLDRGNLEDLARRCGPHVILTIGQALVILTGGIDLSVGNVVALTSMVFARALAGGSSTPLAVILLFLCPLAAGVIHAALVNKVRVPAFVATLGTFCMARSLAEVIHKGSPLPLPDPLTFDPLYYGDWLGVPLPFWCAVAVWLLAEAATRRTVAGRRLYAVGGNETASFLAGVPLWRTWLFAYAACGACVGLAALFWTAKVRQGAPDLGRQFELYAIAGAVIGGVSLKGGRGTMLGAVLGALVIQVLDSAQIQLQEYLSTYWRDFLLGVALVTAVAVDALRRRQRGRLPGRE